MKRPQGPIEIPPSVQNPQENRSRSPKVTFQRGNQKSSRRRAQGHEDETELASRRNVVGLKDGPAKVSGPQPKFTPSFWV